jgi:hypothetical protein
MGDMKVAVAIGAIPGYEVYRKFGHNDTVSGANIDEDVWLYAPTVAQRVLPTTPSVCTIVSNSSLDVDQGTGAWSVMVEGLGPDYEILSEVVELDGLTPVVSTQTFFRVNRMYAVNAGATQENQGLITCTVDSQVQAVIGPNLGQTQQTQYTVPAGKTLIILQYRWHVGRMAGTTDCHMRGQVMYFDDNPVWRTISDIVTYGPDNWSNDAGITLIPEKTEIRLCTNSSGATTASGIWAGFIVDNEIGI